MVKQNIWKVLTFLLAGGFIAGLVNEKQLKDIIKENNEMLEQSIDNTKDAIEVVERKDEIIDLQTDLLEKFIPDIRERLKEEPTNIKRVK